MPEVIECPSCRRRLRLPETLFGRLVQCPTCGQAFTAPEAPEAEPPALPVAVEEPGPTGGQHPASATGELRLSLDDEEAPAGPPRNLPPPPPPLRAVPVREPRRPRTSPDEDLFPCPWCGEEIPRDADRCSFCDVDIDEDDRPVRLRRRDQEPHRGPLILTLGILSIVLFGVCGFLGLAFGIAAWAMGQGDLSKMRTKRMDPEGLSNTKAGYVCGIIGTILDSLWLFLLPGLLR